MQRLQTRNIQWPELILACIGLFVVMAIMIRTASSDCHHWKQQISYVGGAFLAAAGEEEHPLPESGVTVEHQTMRDAARQVLDNRPLGCL